jgi:uncharacterized protein YihD (DUF1040 family)
MKNPRETQRLITQLLKEDMETKQIVTGLEKVFKIDPEDFHTSQKDGQTRIEADFARVTNHTATKDGFNALGVKIHINAVLTGSELNAHVKVWFSNFDKSNPKINKMHKSLTKIKSSGLQEFMRQLSQIIEKEATEAPFENPFMENFKKAILTVLKNRSEGKKLTETYGLKKPKNLAMFLMEH